MRVALVLACLTLAACQTPCPPPAVDTPTLARFHCEDGSDLQVTFTRAQAVVVQDGYATLTLPSRISGSGYRYADNGADLRGRMSEALWTRPGAAGTICQQRQ